MGTLTTHTLHVYNKMACTLSASGLIPLNRAAAHRAVSRKSSCAVKAMAKMPQQQQQGVVSQKAEQLSKSVAAATTTFAAPAFAANESISDVALANVNILGVIAVVLVILYVKSAAEGNVSGGFSQSSYDESKRQGKKLANEAAAIKGAGMGMRPNK